MKAQKMTGYLNLIFVKLNENKTKLQFTNSSKWNPVQKKWGSAIRNMKPGVTYCVATTVTPSMAESTTSWNIIGVLGELSNETLAKELNEHYWNQLSNHPRWTSGQKTEWAMNWGSSLVLKFLPEEIVTIENQTTWKLMKLVQNPDAFAETTVIRVKPNHFSNLFEF